MHGIVPTRVMKGEMYISPLVQGPSAPKKTEISCEDIVVHTAGQSVSLYPPGTIFAESITEEGVARANRNMVKKAITAVTKQGLTVFYREKRLSMWECLGLRK